jgi:hypothetical protein
MAELIEVTENISQEGGSFIMNPKIKKTITEISAAKDKIADLQAKLKTLEQRKIAQENEEIVALFRKERLTEDEFSAYIKTRRGKTDTSVPSTADIPADISVSASVPEKADVSPADILTGRPEKEGNNED